MIFKTIYRNLAFVIIFITLVIIGATYQFSTLPISLYPATSKPTVDAWLNPTGVDQQEFISNWGTRIEDALLVLDGVTKVTSNYYPSAYGYQIEFDWNYDANEALSDVRSALSAFNSRMPQYWGQFWVNENQGSSGRILKMANSQSMPLLEVGTMLHNKLIPLLQRVEGVEVATVTLKDDPKVLIQLNMERLYQYRISPDEVRRVISQRQFDQKLGTMRFKDGSSYDITASLKMDNLEELRESIIQTRGTQTIRLKDVASVKEEQEEQDEINHLNGDHSLFIVVLPKPTANLKNTSDNVDLVIEKFLKTHPELTIETLSSPSKFIDRAISNVGVAVVTAMIIASIIVFLFFGNLRNSIIISLSMPLSLCMTLLIMQIFGVGINLLSLGGMAIAVGMVVDSTIVNLENIVRRVNDKKPQSFEDRINVIYSAVREVSGSIIASAITTVVVFFPMIFTAPMASAVLGDLAIVMVCVITMSLIVSFFIIPSLFLWTSKDSEPTVSPLSRIFMSGFQKLEDLYVYTLKKILSKPSFSFIIVGLVSILLIGSVYLVNNKILREIMPTPKTDILVLGIKPDYNGRENEDIEVMIYEYEQAMINEFSDVFSSVVAGIRKHDIWIAGTLKDLNTYDAVKKRMEERFPDQFDFKVSVFSWSPSKLEIPNPADIRIYVTKENQDDARADLGKIMQTMGKNDKLTQVRLKPGIWKHNRFILNFKEEQIRRINASTSTPIDFSSIQSTLRYAVDEQFLQKIQVSGEERDLYMEYNQDEFHSLEDLSNVLLPVENNVIPLRSLVDLELESIWGHYNGENGEPVFYIEAHIKEDYKGEKDSILADLKHQLKVDGIQTDTLSYIDPTVEIDENINSLFVAILISLALILVVITIQFGNVKLSLLAMSAIPLGFIGVAFSLYLFNEKLSINSMLGLILLCGTAVNNSIIFIDFFIQNSKENKALKMDEVLINTARLRFKPIMMTTLTTIIGMLPIALGFGSGGEILRSLGVTVSGGLGVSTFLTLVFIPLGLHLSDSLKRRTQKARFSSAPAKALASFLVLTIGSALIAPAPYGEASPLSLKEVETKVLEISPITEESAWNIKQSRMLKQEVISETLPNMNYSYLKQRNLGPAIEGGNLTTVNKVSVVQKLPNPYRVYKKWDGLNHLEKSYTDLYNYDVIDVKTDVWIKYYDVVYQKKRMQSMKELLDQFTPRFEEQKKRFDNGLINVDDLQRFRIQWESLRYQVTQRNQLYQAAKLRLATILGSEISEMDDLKEGFPDKFSLENIFESKIRPMLKKPKNLLLDSLQHGIEYKKSVVDDAKFEHLPDIAVAYENSYTNGTKDENILLRAEWSIFTGFKDRNAEIRKKWDLKSDILKLRSESQNWKITLIGIWTQISELEAYRMQLESETESYGKLLKNSEIRYNAGQISSMDLYYDMENLIQATNAYWETNFSIVSNLASLAKHIGEDNIFYQVMNISRAKQ